MYHFHLNETKFDNSLKIDPICNFLTINFCENLQEYFFVRKQFFIINNEKYTKNIYYSILYGCNENVVFLTKSDLNGP